MARGNRYVCATCGKVYEYCSSCNIIKPSYDAETFCSAKHNKIFAILSKHGCNLITADEVLKELEAYNLDEITLTESIQAHLEKIKSEATTKVEEKTIVETEATPITQEVVTEPVVKTEQQSNKNKKKKW